MKKVLALAIVMMVASLTVFGQQKNAEKKARVPAKKETVVADAKFVLGYDEGNQATKINVFYAGKTVLVDSVPGEAKFVDKKTFKSKGIPSAALACCFAWWGGQGQYYYIAKTAKGFAVYNGMEQEEGPAKVTRWKLVKNLKK